MNTQLSNGINLGVKVGGKDLLTSGIVHLHQTDFEIKIDILSIGFCFKSDSEQPRFAGRMDGEKLIIDLFNHYNGLGEGVFEPFEIGSLNGRKLYMTYCSSTVEKETNKRRFEFALYLGEAK